MANYREQFLGETGHKRAAKIRMSPLKLSVERRVLFASSISRRGTTSGCCHVRVNIGSTKPVSTRGYWNSRVHVHCAARVSNAWTSLYPINLLYTDFYALETMISGRSEDQHGVRENDHEHGHPPLTASGRGRFSRYLRFATRMRGGGFREHSGYDDQTYPQAPAPAHQDERD